MSALEKLSVQFHIQYPSTYICWKSLKKGQKEDAFLGNTIKGTSQ